MAHLFYSVDIPCNEGDRHGYEHQQLEAFFKARFVLMDVIQSFVMDPTSLETEALKNIDLLLEGWESDYFQNELIKWIYYTKHQTTQIDPPKACYVTTFSQPTAQKPIPRATASIRFEYEPSQGLSFTYETGKLIHNTNTVRILGNPVKRLREILISKEEMSDRYSAKLIG